jgi:hypothetical protein
MAIAWLEPNAGAVRSGGSSSGCGCASQAVSGDSGLPAIRLQIRPNQSSFLETFIQ